MPEKPRSRKSDFVVYLAVRCVVCLVQALPPGWGRKLAAGLAWLAYRVDRRHREVAAENLRQAFPDWADSPKKIDSLVRATYCHFARVAVEIVQLPRHYRAYHWGKTLSMKRPDWILDALTGDRPVLIVTGHFGNWELAGYALGGFGFKTHAIARVLDNPHLERFLKRFRQATGQSILAKKGDFDRIAGILSGNGTIATLADQDAGKKGLFVEFFGRPASTHKAVALMALESNATMLVVGVPRVGEPNVYQIVCEEVIRPEEYAGRSDAVKLITQRYTSALERLVRRHPEQYFWLHRRWKHQPRVRARKAA